MEGRAEPPVRGGVPRPGGRAAARDAEPRGRRRPRLERPARARTRPGWPARTATSSRRSSPTPWACTWTSSSGSSIDPCSVTVIRYTELRPFVVRVNDTGGGVADLVPPKKGRRRKASLRRRGRRRHAAPPRRVGTCPGPSSTSTRPSASSPGRWASPATAPSTCRPAAAGARSSVALEKVQVQVLAERLEELLETARRSGRRRPGRPPARALEDTAPLDAPVEEEFRVGTMGLAWDGEAERRGRRGPGPGRGGRGRGRRAAQPTHDEGPDALRVHLTAAAARAFVQRAQRVVAAGRPPCPLCGLPLDAEGHICPRQNGHRR